MFHPLPRGKTTDQKEKFVIEDGRRSLLIPFWLRRSVEIRVIHFPCEFYKFSFSCSIFLSLFHNFPQFVSQFYTVCSTIFPNFFYYLPQFFSIFHTLFRIFHNIFTIFLNFSKFFFLTNLTDFTNFIKFINART